VAVLGSILTSGAGASVSLRNAFLLTAGAYGLAVALAAAGRKRTHLEPPLDVGSTPRSSQSADAGRTA
jgi:hypothetical protein